ncbi:unnamed protein product, partial [Medioppia subpectinata]
FKSSNNSMHNNNNSNHYIPIPDTGTEPDNTGRDRVTTSDSSDTNSQSTSTHYSSADGTAIVPNTIDDGNNCEEKKTVGHRTRRIPALGIMMAFMSVLCYSLGSAVVNLMPELHSLEILGIRALFQFVVFGFVVLVKQYRIIPTDGQTITLVLRCVSGTITLTTVFVAYRLMPLADASTIQFASPVFVAIFAYFMLRERINCLQGIAGLVTLVGVVVIAQPEFLFGTATSQVYDQRLLGTALAVVSSVSGAFSMITLRKLKATPVPVIVTWYGMFVTLVCLAIVLGMDVLTLPVGWYTWSLLLAVGLCGIGDQYFVTKALCYESAGPVSVTRTLTVVMTFIWEAVILDKTIEWLSMVGAAIITSCILLIALDKWRHESPDSFRKLSCGNWCCACAVQDDYYDKVESSGEAKPFGDRYASYYDSADHYRNHKQLYYDQFSVAIDGSPTGPHVTNK